MSIIDPGPKAAVEEAHGAVSAPPRRKVLLVDDEPSLVDVLQHYLLDEGFLVERADDGPSAVEAFIKHEPDIVVLDLNLPGFPGTDVLRQIRAVRDVPVIILTARVHEVDRVVGLGAHAHHKHVGTIAIDTLAHEVHVDGKLVTLTPTQFKILDVLVSHTGQTLTRDQLLERVSADGDVFDRTLDRHIANLRARVEADPSNPRYIVTVFGVGYKMVDPS